MLVMHSDKKKTPKPKENNEKPGTFFISKLSRSVIHRQGRIVAEHFRRRSTTLRFFDRKINRFFQHFLHRKT